MSLALALFGLMGQSASLPEITLRPGMTITHSARVRPGVYRFASKSETGVDPAIRVKGEDLTLDFRGVTLEGSAPTVDPDARAGTGVLVEGKRITIRNAKVRGYKVGLHARNVDQLRILDSDFSYNWKQRLLSTPEREDLADWMSYHKNENDEWLRYGAGMYLRDCDGFHVENVRAVGGQNGLLLTGCDKGMVWNSNFSFLSSLGIGMYRSSHNLIVHNRIDWCVRGFSYGVYNRGQDSAGILIYEQSNSNVFAYNSVTHGGDGFFLWAGQTTMDTGKGGCNDNILYANDFSHAPTNGIEATFSRNKFAHNLILECWHGIWGGYSYDTDVVGNTFGYNAEAIAIEHGQNNTVLGNTFLRDHEGLVFWFNDRPQDPNWGYPKFRDTRSRDVTVDSNRFTDIRTNVFRVHNTQNFKVLRNEILAPGNLFALTGNNENVAFEGNRVVGAGRGVSLPPSVKLPQGNPQPSTANIFVSSGPFARAPLPPASSLNQGDFKGVKEYLARFDVGWQPFGMPALAQAKTPNGARLHEIMLPYRLPRRSGGIDPFLKKGTLRGWRYIIVDEWGPYDFKRPILVARGEAPDGRAVFELLGPTGSATIQSLKGFAPEAASLDGLTWKSIDHKSKLQVPGWIRMKRLAEGGPEAEMLLDYVGQATTDVRGVVTPKGKRVRFGFRKFDVPIDWNVKFYGWDPAKVADPKAKMPAPGELLSRTELGQPLARWQTTKLDFASGGSPREGVPGNHFITLAEGTMTLPAGDYEIGVTSDDGIRLWLDDKLVIDQWHWQGPTRYTHTAKLGGAHRLRLEHYEIDGYTALKVDVRPLGNR